jgi:hypothetical protein
LLGVKGTNKKYEQSEVSHRTGFRSSNLLKRAKAISDSFLTSLITKNRCVWSL